MQLGEKGMVLFREITGEQGSVDRFCPFIASLMSTFHEAWKS